MKKVIFLIFAAVVFVSCNSNSSSSTNKEAPQKEKKMSFREQNSPKAKYERMCNIETHSPEIEAMLDSKLSNAPWEFVNGRGVVYEDNSEGYPRYIFIISTSNDHDGYGCVENCDHINDGAYRKVRFVTVRDAGLGDGNKILRMEAKFE